VRSGKRGEVKKPSVKKRGKGEEKDSEGKMTGPSSGVGTGGE